MLIQHLDKSNSLSVKKRHLKGLSDTTEDVHGGDVYLAESSLPSVKARPEATPQSSFFI